MKKIKKHINRLSVTEPDARKLWKHIESGLLIDGLYSEINRSSLENAIKDLPAFNPQRDIWQKIDQSIVGPGANKKIHVLNNRFTKVAASLVFLVTSYLMIKIIVPEIRQHKLDSLKKQPIESFLATLCTRYPQKCQEPDFLEMKTEIIQLNNEKSEIENSIFFNPDDAVIARINNRIDNQIINLRDQIIDYVE